MRVILILAVLLPSAVLIAWAATRPIAARLKRRRHIEQLERENRRLDSLIGGQQFPNARKKTDR